MGSEPMETRNRKRAQQKVPPHGSANGLEENIEKEDTGSES